MRNKKRPFIQNITKLLLLSVIIGGSWYSVTTPKEQPAFSMFESLQLLTGYEKELKPGEVIKIIDQKTGAMIDQENRVIYVGDEYITENNQQYRVVKVKGHIAYAKSMGKVTDIVWKDEWDVIPTAKTTSANNLIAIYHTHSDESYVPTDGSESIPAKGGIYKVGQSLATELRSVGMRVIDNKASHEPHDANAYHRSRRTATQLLAKKPVILLDVHRDGVPDPNFYNKKIDNKNITKVRLVVGRQNPKMASNMQFAKQIKAYMDKHKPGLIQGIFIGHGNYNQDLAPRAMLIEVGTHTNTRQRAQLGATVFGQALPAVLNLEAAGVGGPGSGAGAGTTGITGTTRESNTAWKTVGWLVGITVVAGAIFLFISTGSIKGMKSKLGELRKTEFANFFGIKKSLNRRRKK